MVKGWSIARRLFWAHALFIVVLTAFVGTAAFVDARDRGFDDAESRMLAIATSIADSPLTLAASQSSDPSSTLQPYALQVTRDARLDFITIMAPDRTRWTHPTASEIGKPYIGAIDTALAGNPLTEVSTGTLGPSVRAVVPIVDDAGIVHGLVAAGTTTSSVTIALNARLPAVLGLSLGLLAAGSIVSLLLGRYLRRVTLGWGPEQLAQLFVYYDSVLHSVREGLVLVDPNGTLLLYNDQAARLLGIAPRTPSAGIPVSLPHLGLPASLDELLRSGRAAHDEIHLTATRVLVVSQEPAETSGRSGWVSGWGWAKRMRRAPAPMGRVVTIRDHTDLQSLGNELQSMRTLSEALRAQTHEHSNRLHTIVSLMELGRTEEALEFATQDLELSQQLTDEMLSSVDEPVISALIMGKAAQANELGIALNVTASGNLTDSGLSVQDLVTVLGNLVDNALDAAASAAASGVRPRRVDVGVSETDGAVIIEVGDSGPGVDPQAAEDILRLGFSTKEPGSYGRGLGLALVRQAVVRLGGTLTIGRGMSDALTGAVFTVTIPAAARVGVPEEIPHV
ncbi:sensor histidine kinase [Cryobacterium melibiosiphilum]|uniref:histidine kinase n=1 Tax=Cryobacterium melibiosiphilum TaxID=995039 RepID=A0A3A5MDZ0_9MICO|nr:sensor histidine kinase [Cryobacterium melibiosiphilum]RJT84807.1 sensor histidine kinase [Cryobacterium melibiosiphilum]